MKKKEMEETVAQRLCRQLQPTDSVSSVTCEGRVVKILFTGGAEYSLTVRRTKYPS